MTSPKDSNLGQPRSYTFAREERLKSKKEIEELFSNGSSFSVYPYKVFFKLRNADSPLASEIPAQVMFSAPKRRFPRAVDRTTIRRRMRESYRLNKHLLIEGLLPNEASAAEPEIRCAIAYIYIGQQQLPWKKVESAMRKSLMKIVQHLTANESIA